MKFLFIFLAFLYFQPVQAEDCCTGPNVYYVKDVGESAYFLVEKLKSCGILARIVIIHSKERKIIFDHTTALFIHTPKTRRAHHSLVEPFLLGRFPDSCISWLTLMDPKKCAVFIGAYDSRGCFIDLRPYLFPKK